MTLEAKDGHNFIIASATLTICAVLIGLYIVFSNEREAARALEETQRMLDQFR